MWVLVGTWLRTVLSAALAPSILVISTPFNRPSMDPEASRTITTLSW